LFDALGYRNSSESTEEDRIMIAFFDSQVRRQNKIEETINKSLFKFNNQDNMNDNYVISDEDVDDEDDKLANLNSVTEIFDENSTSSSDSNFELTSEDSDDST